MGGDEKCIQNISSENLKIRRRRIWEDNITTGKGKVVPVLLTEHHAIKAYWWSGVTVPRILALGTRWR
jgi:hypothetical protein